ncbi:unnamed protein product [Pleuronectes platessa]|uniref:Uncharacterized protein n=1 Tax=Pleuronectes platessa TaxID=8262 RepID=A0A9N7YS13_PLEPL|nr:unnamed protein product [Pleuronectes platessa]
MRVNIPKDNPNMRCQAVPLQSQSMVSNQQDHDPPSRPDATPVLSHQSLLLNGQMVSAPKLKVDTCCGILDKL